MIVSGPLAVNVMLAPALRVGPRFLLANEQSLRLVAGALPTAMTWYVPCPVAPANLPVLPGTMV